jgi:DNA-binding NtrC family response regulator
VVSLNTPPLREHKEDIPMLVSFLVENTARSAARSRSHCRAKRSPAC